MDYVRLIRRVNPRGSFFSLTLFQGSGRGRRIIIPPGLRQEGWKAFQAAIEYLSWERSKPVVGMLRKGISSRVVDNGDQAKVVELDVDAFGDWAEAVVCSVRGPGDKIKWKEGSVELEVGDELEAPPHGNRTLLKSATLSSSMSAVSEGAIPRGKTCDVVSGASCDDGDRFHLVVHETGATGQRGVVPMVIVNGRGQTSEAVIEEFPEMEKIPYKGRRRSIKNRKRTFRRKRLRSVERAKVASGGSLSLKENGLSKKLVSETPILNSVGKVVFAPQLASTSLGSYVDPFSGPGLEGSSVRLKSLAHEGQLRPEECLGGSELAYGIEKDPLGGEGSSLSQAALWRSAGQLVGILRGPAEGLRSPGIRIPGKRVARGSEVQEPESGMLQSPSSCTQLSFSLDSFEKGGVDGRLPSPVVRSPLLQSVGSRSPASEEGSGRLEKAKNSKGKGLSSGMVFNLSFEEDTDERDESGSDRDKNGRPCFSLVAKDAGFLDKELAASGFTRKNQDDIEKCVVVILIMQFV
ncbi:hypothetical protein HHK36_001450 [Tetracentron sinense]|uniref:Uncharacterized protein n=1 Tax=Tetracentron sinense TaxID=13715 RepID=A0A835DS15_TETSI|nr:hypothetical protein HHK36_001450 [Tetracentron sinense]